MKFRPPFMVQTSLKHQENPSEYLIYRPLLHIMTNRPPCRCLPLSTLPYSFRSHVGHLTAVLLQQSKVDDIISMTFWMNVDNQFCSDFLVHRTRSLPDPITIFAIVKSIFSIIGETTSNLKSDFALDMCHVECGNNKIFN